LIKGTVLFLDKGDGSIFIGRQRGIIRTVPIFTYFYYITLPFDYEIAEPLKKVTIPSSNKPIDIENFDIYLKHNPLKVEKTVEDFCLPDSEKQEKKDEEKENFFQKLIKDLLRL
jgi:hypothetical protein